MGHYWSEMRGDPTPEETEKEEARALVKKLRAFRASEFTVDELSLLLRCGWSSAKSDYYLSECKEIRKIAQEKGLTTSDDYVNVSTLPK